MISAITLVAALVFLCPNIAIAESPVQPLQVVTYSDTSTQLRISGTAERLHYNVDSFQVVFTNPPNNYGTACTPVLVSFRFYNSSDLPAYVGQAEFEIVCTNGTGSTNLIIYGYDQISTDLFVAESSYSTSEVGRIGIGASNDFAYYTGFVVPPKTSLYFSAIVYVNASAYEGVSNVTGSQEQVNQLTMSSLNLYSNQISFSADYPYHNQPIDFSEIIQTISDLSDTVSTSSEMQTLIDAVTYTGNNFTPVSGNIVTDVVEINDYQDLTIRSYRHILPPHYLTEDIELDASSDQIVQAGTLVYKVICTTYWRNNNIKDYRVRNFFRHNNVLPALNNGISFSFEQFNSDYCEYRYETGRNIDLVPYSINGNYSYLTAGKSGYSINVIYVYCNVGVTPSWSTYSFSIGSTVPTLVDHDIGNSNNIFDLLRGWFNSYRDVNGIGDLTEESEDIKDVSDDAHAQEQSYYSANASAIEQTGLSNYRFNNDQINGIGSVSNDFILLWNALGSFNGVFIFSLTLSLALMILRHSPGAISKAAREDREIRIRNSKGD